MPSGRNRIAAALLAFLLGSLGIHKFYLGRVGQGMLYLAFCWTIVPALIGYVEGITYVMMSIQILKKSMVERIRVATQKALGRHYDTSRGTI